MSAAPFQFGQETGTAFRHGSEAAAFHGGGPLAAFRHGGGEVAAFHGGGPLAVFRHGGGEVAVFRHGGGEVAAFRHGGGEAAGFNGGGAVSAFRGREGAAFSAGTATAGPFRAATVPAGAPPHGELARMPWFARPFSLHKLDRRTVTTAIPIAIACGLLVGGIPGIAVGAVAFIVTALILHHREPPETKQVRARLTADLPFAVDLMAACLQAGHPISTATETAATAIKGPLGDRLAWISTQLRLGADPAPTWTYLTTDPPTAPLGRTMSRSAQTGAPVADALTRLANESRDAARGAALATARTVGIKAVAPLGLCFLPAFVLLGIVPVVAGLASTITLP
ncbi:type II secretion system F family protein [Nonomuraea sp. NPDC050536]|uniref:type II secretion system F family protein n=1 Tax=Nonomuraea sp. NPDC050536 TaxID=3364366 RepID=UPI0037C71DA9